MNQHRERLWDRVLDRAHNPVLPDGTAFPREDSYVVDILGPFDASGEVVIDCNEMGEPVVQAVADYVQHTRRMS